MDRNDTARYARRAGLLTVAIAYGVLGPGAGLVVAANGVDAGRHEIAWKRTDADDAEVVLHADPDGDGIDDDEIIRTVTSNADGDRTRGDDGTNGGKTVTANADGDDTRGDDGTSDGDFTEGEDGTSLGDNTGDEVDTSPGEDDPSPSPSPQV
ncbi:MAG: hypothetical protein ACKOTZ_09660 [Chloroflexota bacterium]